MEFNQKLIDRIDKAIAKDQHPNQREHPLTLGLMQAKEIIKEYAEQQAGVAYEYTKDGQVWLDVKNKENLQALIGLGCWVRKKK